MPKTLTATSTSINPGLIALTPRQVLLANPKMTAAKPSALDGEDKKLLLLSIAQYLQKNGFSKTLKKFKTEAQLEEDGWMCSKLDLEEMCLKFLDKGSNVATHPNGLGQDGKKKKKSKADDENVVANQADSLSKGSQELQQGESKEPDNVAISELQPNEPKKKKKDKKKKDHKSEPESVIDGGIETMPEATKGKSEDLTSSMGKKDVASEVNSKDKKKKKSKSISSEVINDGEEPQDAEKPKSTEMDAEKGGSEGEAISTEIKKENKQQKRKRTETEENGSQPVKETVEKSKRRKKENKENMASEQNSEVKASQKGEVDLLESQKTPLEHLDDKENGNLNKTAEKSTAGKKQRNGSAEPQSTTAKAFQRIKVEEVEFADERLKDNSYWAKDGAEVGYGAKAQEVLGQVRGRDFRHEKTKKKRGSYRGGIIDLQSHSVKFNYDDDE